MRRLGGRPHRCAQGDERWTANPSKRKVPATTSAPDRLGTRCDRQVGPKRPRDVRPARHPMRPREPTLASRRARVTRRTSREADRMTPSKAALARRRRLHLAVNANTGLRKKTPTRKEIRRTVCEDGFGRIPAPAKSKRCWSEPPTRLRTDGRKVPGTKRRTERSASLSRRLEPRARGQVTARSGLSSTHEKIAGNKEWEGRRGCGEPRRDESGAGRREVRSERKNGHEGDLGGEKAQEGQASGSPNTALDGTDCPAEQSLGGPVPRQIRPRRRMLETALSRRSRIDGEEKSEEEKGRGDAHRLQGRRVLRGVRASMRGIAPSGDRQGTPHASGALSGPATADASKETHRTPGLAAGCNKPASPPSP